MPTTSTQSRLRSVSPARAMPDCIASVTPAGDDPVSSTILNVGSRLSGTGLPSVVVGSCGAILRHRRTRYGPPMSDAGDQLAIRRLVDAYAIAIDDCDTDTLAALFLPEGRLLFCVPEREEPLATFAGV